MKPLHVFYTVLATVVIFAAGVVTGGVLVRKTSPKVAPPPAPQGFQMMRFNQFQHAVHELDLEPEQRQRVNRIVRDRQEYIAEVMRLIEPDMPGQFVRMRSEINRELQPEQVRRLDDMWARMERQKKFQNRSGEFMGRPGEPPNGRPSGPGPR